MTNLHVTMTPFRHESRVLKETGTLVAQGVFQRVVILALHEDGLPTHEAIDGRREVRRIPLRSRALPRSLPFQVLKYLEFLWRVLVHARAVGVAAVSVHALALLPVGVAVKLLCGARLVYDAHELETEVDGLGGVRQLLARMVERLTLRWADLAIVVGPGIADWYRERYPRLPIATVLNCPPYRPPSRSRAIQRALGLPDETRVLLYQGGLCTGRGVEALLDAFPASDQAGWILVFMGYGPLQEQIERVQAARRDVFHLPAVPPGEVLPYTASADVGACLIAGTCLSYRLSLPNKLFEYAMAGVPILCSDLPEMAALVRRHEVGFVFGPEEPRSLVETLNAIYRSDLAAHGERTRAFARQYNWENQEPTMVTAYREYVCQ